VFGIAWVIVGVVILQFDQASITTVGVIVGLMFLATAVHGGHARRASEMALRALRRPVRRRGRPRPDQPGEHLRALADILGFLFLIVGVFWVIQALV
jgi:hypothetical protein